MAQPHFLGLPRELRDIVYNYLYQDTCVHWFYDKPVEFKSALIICHNAPLVEVLLLSSQQRDEYLGSSCFHKPYVIMKLYVRDLSTEDLQLSVPDSFKDFHSMLRSARRLTLFVDVVTVLD